MISTRQFTHDGDWEDGQATSVGWLSPQDEHLCISVQRMDECPYFRHLKHCPSFLTDFSTTFRTEKKLILFLMALFASSGSLRCKIREEKGFPASMEYRLAHLMDSREPRMPSLIATRFSTSSAFSGSKEVGIPCTMMG